MATVKEQAIGVIQALPDNCALEDIQYHLYVREAVTRGMRDVDAGRVVSQEDAERRIAAWAKSSGQRLR